MRLEGKKSIVTGAASGIGKAIARRFAAEGAEVAILDMPGCRFQRLPVEVVWGTPKAFNPMVKEPRVAKRTLGSGIQVHKEP